MAEDSPRLIKQITDTSGETFDICDPNVPAWAKASTKPTYTAAEVGAVPMPTSNGNLAADVYVPTMNSSNSWYKATASTTPGSYKIAKYDSSSYLKSTTPSAGDSSTKVATTAFVQDALPTDAEDVGAVPISRTVNGYALSSDITLSAADVGALANTVTYANSPVANGNATISNGILYGMVDGTSTSTAFTATIDGLDSYYDGVCVVLKNGVVSSASGFTININSLGAKPVYNNMTATTRETTIFNIDYTMMFIYDSTRVTGGCWVCYRGYDSTDTVYLRPYYYKLPAADTGYRYRLWFTSLDGESLVPANISTSTNATAVRTPNTRTIDPFGAILYCVTNRTYTAGNNLADGVLYQQYALSLGYSFNTTGSALTLTYPAPVYLQCTPQIGGGVQMDGYTQSLPSNEDGKVYIFLGMAYNATNINLTVEHPVYYYSNGAIRLWTNTDSSSSGSVSPATATPLMNGTAAVGTSDKYAREDHVHPSDTTKANLASPALTGTPTAPTATAGTNTTQIATTAFVGTAVSGKQDTISDLATIRSNATNGETAYTRSTNKVLYFTSQAVSATTGDIATISNSAITADHVVATAEFADPSYITTQVTWTTSSGSLVLNGTCTAATTVNVILIKKDN